MRYYLIVKTEYLQLDENGNPISDRYNEVTQALFNLGRVINLNANTMRKSLDGTLAIAEVHDLEKNIDKNKIGQIIEKPFSFYEQGEVYTERILVEEKLEQLKQSGIIEAYGHYPHLNDGKQACIHCYLKQNKALWEPEEPVM